MTVDAPVGQSRTARRALAFILVLGGAGLLFSGYLTWRELFAPAASVVSCTPVGAPGTILGLPPCVYGFMMYLAITVAAALGLVRGGRRVKAPRLPLRSNMTGRERPVVSS